MLTLKLIQPNCGRVVSPLPDDRRSIISICPSTKSPSSTPCPPKDPKSLRRPVSELSQLEDTQEEDAALESDEDQEYPLLESCKIKKRVVVPGITIERAWWDREDPCETCLLSFLGLGCLVLIGLFSFLVHASVGSDTSDLWNSTSTTGTSPVSPTSASYNKGVNHESPKGKSFWGQLVDFAWPIALRHAVASQLSHPCYSQVRRLLGFGALCVSWLSDRALLHFCLLGVFSRRRRAVGQRRFAIRH
jgi:hypothetical protein